MAKKKTRGSFRLPSAVTIPCCKTNTALRTPYSMSPVIPRGILYCCVALTRKEPPHATRMLAIIRSISVCPVAMCSRMSTTCITITIVKSVRIAFILLILIRLAEKANEIAKKDIAYAKNILYYEPNEIH